MAKKQQNKTEQEKLAERREEVLATGRKFKYPLQYAKHKLVINTIIIAFAAIVLIVISGWLALYKAQTSGDIFYRITQVLPIGVASVDGKSVRYSDYLMVYRSSLKTVEQQSGKLGDDEDAMQVKNNYKRTALNNAEEYTYALKLAAQNNINITNEDVNKEFDQHRKVGGADRSEESFLKILEDNFGMNETEYKRMIYLSLVRSEVMSTIDDKANTLVSRLEQILSENDNDMADAAEELGEAVQYEETGGLVDSMNVDGGRATVAMTLEPGEMSGKFMSNNGDGYYYVKLIAKNETQVNYASIKIPFTTFTEQFKKLREDGKIVEYITLNNVL